MRICSPIHIDSKPHASISFAVSTIGGPNQTQLPVTPNFMGLLFALHRS
jgi:hypothetical protein